MTRNQDKRHLTLRSVLYPSLKRKTDKVKFILLGFVVIMAVVIAGCPMEINTNIGTDRSTITKAPPLPGDTEYLPGDPYPVPGPDVFVPYDLNRLRVINITTRAVESVKIEGTESLAVSATIGTNEQKVFIVEPKTLPAKSGDPVPPENYQVKIAPHSFTATARMPPDAAILISLDAGDNEIITVIPDDSLVPPYIPKTPGVFSARIIIYNTSNDHEITGIQIDGVLVKTVTIPRWTAPTTSPPSLDQIEKILVADPEAHTITAVRSSGGDITTDPISMTDNGIYSIFIGNTAATVFDFDPPGPVKELVLTPNHVAGSVTATWKAPDEIPPDFAGYTIQLDGGTPISISRDPSTLPNAPEIPLDFTGLPLGLHTVTVSARDTNGNYSTPAVAGAILLTQVSVNITTEQLPEPVMYSKATTKIDATDWEATINWTSITHAGASTTTSTSLETITGVPRYRGANKYTAEITITAKTGNVLGGPIKYNNEQIDSLPSPVVKTVSSVLFPSETLSVGKYWYVWQADANKTLTLQPASTRNNAKDYGLGPWSGTGEKNDPVSRLEIVAHRIVTERESIGRGPTDESPVCIYAMGELLDGWAENGASEPVMKIDGPYWPKHVLLQGGNGETLTLNGDANFYPKVAKISGTARDTIQVGAGKIFSLGGSVIVSCINTSQDSLKFAAILVEDGGIFKLDDASGSENYTDVSLAGKFVTDTGSAIDSFSKQTAPPQSSTTLDPRIYGTFPVVGDSAGYGIKVKKGAKAYLRGGSVRKCTSYGIYFDGGSWTTIDNITVEQNYMGIFFKTDGTAFDASNGKIKITNSTIRKNNRDGIVVESGDKGINLEIGENTKILANNEIGLDLKGYSNTTLTYVEIAENGSSGIMAQSTLANGIATVTMDNTGNNPGNGQASYYPRIRNNKSSGVFLGGNSHVIFATGLIQDNTGDGQSAGGVYLTNVNSPLSEVMFEMTGGIITNNSNQKLLYPTYPQEDADLPQQGAGGVGIYITGIIGTNDTLVNTVAAYKVRFKKTGGKIADNNSITDAASQIRVAYDYRTMASSMNPDQHTGDPAFVKYIRDLTWGGTNRSIDANANIDFRFSGQNEVLPQPTDWSQSIDNSSLSVSGGSWLRNNVPVWRK
ncbi:MAG: right-handed parallel beta-helix repeat-containing protein [Treponema sp.]|jgi:hypothetical protein|nr:right-handed parallel beta-helix repeat-containing protein [Treponema sp.]